jgi:hypothetical protein
VWYFNYWVLNIILKLLCLLAGRFAVDIWYWRFWGWSGLCMVHVDSPWWQWHLNGSRLSFLCLCRNIVLLIRNDGEFSFIVCGLWNLLCCDLYKEIMMAAIFIYIVTLFLLLVGGDILDWDVMHFWECLYFCCIVLHLCKRCSILNSNCPISSCIRLSFVLTLKMWMESVYYCGIEEIDVFYIDLRIDKPYSLNVVPEQWCGCHVV